MRTPAPGAATTALAPDHPFWDLKRRIVERTGHFYYQDKDDLLWERVGRRLAALRLTDLGAYLNRLEEEDRGPQEWAALEAEITIGETFFFRYAEQFDALARTILPDILARRAESRRLRIWSAGCATGAEPYSLAILIDQLLGEALPEWRVNILGTDINHKFLDAAREGVFGQWALRSLSPAQREAWFDAPGPGRWTLKPQYRRMVRFERGNLLDLLGPAAPLEWSDFDLILCRNVLIYFHPQVVTSIAAALVARLSPTGWLLVGHAEPNPDFIEFAAPNALPGAVAYRPLGSPPSPRPEPLAVAWTPEIAPQTPSAPPSRPARPPRGRPAPPVAAAVAPPTEPEALELVDQVRRRADVGDYAGAAEACAEALALSPQDATLHFYDGLIRQAQGDMAAAEDAFRRAAYLDAGFVMALYHLGLSRMARGRAAAGRRSVAAAAQLAGTMPASERLREGAGLTARGLRELARAQLEAGKSGGHR